MGIRRLHKSEILKKFIHLTLTVILFIGCYTYSKGPLQYEEEIPISKTILSKEYNVNILSKPAPGKPILTLKIEEKIKYRTTVIPHHTKMKKSWSAIPLTLSFYALTSFIKNDSIKRPLRLVATVFGIVSLISELYEEPKPTSQTIQGNPYTKIKETEFKPLNDNYLDVNILLPSYKEPLTQQKVQKSISTNLLNGILIIDFSNILPAHIFKSDSDIINVIILKDGEKIYNLNLFSSEISSKCVRVKADKLFIFDSPSGGAKISYSVSKGEIFPIISRITGWLQIEYQNGKYGWIPEIGVEEVWLIYKK